MAVVPDETFVKLMLKITEPSGNVAAGYLYQPNLMTPGVLRLVLIPPPIPGPIETDVAVAIDGS